MLLTATEGESAAWLSGLWVYYRDYTRTAIHAASAAALTAFGLLIFIDPLFLVLAIGAYVCPPLILYSTGADAGTPSDSPQTVAVEADPKTDSNSDSVTDSDGDDGDSDSDSDVGDTDSDGSAADADGTDADANG